MPSKLGTILGLAVIFAGIAVAALAYVPYPIITTLTGNELGMLGPKSSTQVYFFPSDIVQGHAPVRTLAPSAPAAPSLASCGTGSPTITGTDGQGTVTTGTSAATCHVNFATAYTNKPNCTVTWQVEADALSYSIAVGGLVVTPASSVSGHLFNYRCSANAGG
ncbi:MAG TPA: hypothetical protein VGR84_18630 [Candidatus Acidoferrales bacterium]|nr:hypothetical protein [Candidatus Acidoferrales bacterium]